MRPGEGGEGARDVRPLVEHFFRHETGRVTATLTRMFGFENLDVIEDVVQEALVRALDTWPFHGVPENPSAWVIQVAKNRARDIFRREKTWSEKAPAVRHARLEHRPPADREVGYPSEVTDDQLRMVFTCCHPLLGEDAQVALTLKVVGGFSVPELARAFLVREATMAQRLVRAKRTLRDACVRLEMPAPGRLAPRLDAVLDVLYLMFNEGHGATGGEHLIRRDLCQEAIRLAELVAEHPEVGAPRAHALAALMLFQAARLDTRVGPEGEALLLEEQDRSSWDRGMIARGLRHLLAAAEGNELSEFHLQAEIAAHHATAPSWEATDWERILACYDQLSLLNPSPIVALNRAVALAEVRSAEEALEALGDPPALVDYYPSHAVRGALLARAGLKDDARDAYRNALRAPVPEPVRRVLERRLEDLG